MASADSETFPDEATPLLDAAAKHEEIYKRFKPARKRVILGIVSFFVSGIFVPSIPQISRDLNSTPSTVSLAVSISVLALALGSLFWARYSRFYGRRPIYLVGSPLLLVGSLGVATSQSITELMIWRFVQAIGASPGQAVGAGVIADIYKLEERGQAMGIFFAAILLGPTTAPLVGGIAAHYSSWRIMQAALGGIGCLVWLLTLFILPETYHPGERGVDKADPTTLSKWRPVVLNPFDVLWILRSPNIWAVLLLSFFALMTDYVLLVPLAYTIGAKYGITNEALVGACFLPSGLGNMVAAPFAGRLSDMIVKGSRKARGGAWYPEDRLRITFVGGLVLVPLGILLSGLITHYIDGRLGLMLNLICLFGGGIGLEFVLGPSAAYIVDLLHSRSAEAMAATNGVRALLMAIAISGILPSIEKYGLVATNTGSAISAWVGCGLIWATIRYGDYLRGLVDVGYSTIENN
ncbi:hypothetical protein D9619_012519 [Psilocybe cf. subviscida]|uniref:Major facilitator superfamily (MFS) profile domain-containing protein n=1 Tax=Psilocybe cf. subviscida TaxID=2480587 RepID=A0A8H5B6V9_9AGAR|nr:hypothetical protein D9619_012519 [Psilocybe cf. subviscida]